MAISSASKQRKAVCSKREWEWSRESRGDENWTSRTACTPSSSVLWHLAISEAPWADSVVKWVKLLSRVWLFTTPWTCQAPSLVRFSRQESWSGLPFPSPGALPDPGIEPRSSALQADSLPSEPPGKLAFCNIQYTVHCFCGPKKQCVISVLLLETRF